MTIYTHDTRKNERVKAGELHSGKGGKVVKNPRQAVAIALSEAGMSKPKKQTRMDRAAQIGISIPTLNSWTRCGVDVFKDEDVRKRISKMRNLPPDLKPEWHPQISQPINPPGEDPTQIDIEHIIHQLSNVTDKHQAKTVKIQIDGLLNAYKLRVSCLSDKVTDI